MNILFLSHNIPYPPNKGEKIRAYHQIKHLSQSHKVFLFSFVKDPNDMHYEAELKKICSDVQLFPIHSLRSKIKSLLCVASPFPMTFGYYHSYWLHREIKKTMKRQHFDVVFAYCSSMGQYLLSMEHSAKVIDFVDIDSFKWKEYSSFAHFPISFIYSLEYRRLRKWEGILSACADLNLLIRQKITRHQFRIYLTCSS